VAQTVTQDEYTISSVTWPVNCTSITSFAVLEELDTRVEEAHQAGDKRRLARLQTAVEEVIIVVTALGKNRMRVLEELA